MDASEISKWLTAIARLGLSAVLLLAAWLLATCGAPQSSPSNASADDNVLVEYQRTGGIAGFDDQLIIRTSGETTLKQKGEQRETFTLNERTVSKLRQMLNKAEFFKLNSQYRPARIVPDALMYHITCQSDGRRHTLETTDGAIPEQLAPVLDELNQIIIKH